MSVALAGRADAQAPAPSASPENAVLDGPSASPSATADVKQPTAAALAIALTMRRFDPKLTDAQIDTIALGIDAHNGAGASLAPKKRRLRNSDAPVTTFTVPVTRA